jgi:transcriptional regulator with XRE-family HTH domain
MSFRRQPNNVITNSNKHMGRIREALNAIINDRNELGKLTQGEIAKRIGVQQATVSQYLSGTRAMSEEVIEKFCDALGVKLADLEAWNPELAKIRFTPTVCPKNREDHLLLHKYLERVLEAGGRPADWLGGNIVTFYAQLSGEEPDLSALGPGEPKNPPTNAFGSEKRGRRRPR